MMKPIYFGYRWGDAVDEPELMGATPIGELCLRCEEPIAQGDAGIETGHIGPDGFKFSVHHRECWLRSMLGSVAHIERRCPCFGGTDLDGDPPGLTKREAARAALIAFHGRRHE